MLKKGVIIGCILCAVWVISACQSKEDSPKLEEIEALLESLNYHTIYLAVTHQSPGADMMEIIDFSVDSQVHIHAVYIGSHDHDRIDFQWLLTSTQGYDTRTMTYTIWENPLETFFDFQERVESVTVLADFEWFAFSVIMAYISELENLSLSERRGVYTLRGTVPKTEVDEETIEAFVLVFDQTSIVEMHFRVEHDFESTKKENAYISGTHYYTYPVEMPVFPSLHDFEPK